MRKIVASLLISSALLVAFSPMGGAEEEEPFHYLEQYGPRYEAFLASNPNIPFEKAIALVNVNLDKGFYNEIETVGDPDCIAVLVNKSFALPAGYVPPDLVTITGGHLMRSEAAEQFEMMREEMLSLGYRVHVVVTYRSFHTQTNTYNNAVARFGRVNADVSFARPGHSEHQTGLAIDILHMGGFEFMQRSGFQHTREFTWLTENAHRYGFILRYPDGFRDIHGFIFEPWHWRFVGVFNAMSMYFEGIALFEEFYGRYLAPAVLEKWENETMALGWTCW